MVIEDRVSWSQATTRQLGERDVIKGTIPYRDIMQLSHRFI